MSAAIQQSAAQAIEMAGITVEEVAAAGLGIAGFDWPSQEPQMLEAIRQAIPLKGSPAICNDAVLGLLAGTAEGWGVTLVAGTSNNCRGRDRHGREGRVTGDGSLFGEYGGAYELAAKALHVVVAAWSKRGPATMLTGALVAHLGARDVEEMIEGIALGRYELGAGAAPLVFGAAHAGDPVARDVIAWAGRELGSLAVGVIHQLSFEALSFDVVLVGSVFNGGPLLVEPLSETVHAVAPGARLLRLTAPPVTGAVLLGMPRSGHDRAALRETLLRTTSHLLHKPGAQEPPRRE